jgi:hypothetical protein
MFDRMANGKNVITRSELDDRGQNFFDKIAGKLGITGNQITREQFQTYMSQPDAERRGGPRGSPQPPGAAPPGSVADGQSGGATDPNRMAQFAEESFRRHDKNGDGVLSGDEIPDDLRATLEMWDTDHNGLIDLNEYKAYFQARREQRMMDRNQASDSSSWQGPMPAAPPTPVAPGKTAPPLVYHTDNLPKELPSWFRELDTNHDAQIGLYEWRLSGRPIADFLAMDRNNDGFLTVEEVLQYEAKKAQNQPGNTGSRSSSPGGAMVRGRSR